MLQSPVEMAESTPGERFRLLGPAVAIVVLTALNVTLELAPDTSSAEAVGIAAIDALLNELFLLGGVVAWVLRPRTVLGPALVAAALAFPLGNLAFVDDVPVLHTLGMLSIGLFAGPLTVVLLAYPTGRVSGRRARQLVALTWFHVTVQWWLFLTTYDPVADGCGSCRSDLNLLGLWGDQEIYEVLVIVQPALSGVLALGVMHILVQRYRYASVVRKRLLRPILVAGVVCALATLVTAPFAYDRVAPTTESVLLHAVWAVAFGLVPTCFAIGLIRDAVRRANVSRLLVALEHGGEPELLVDAVRRALGDDGADVVLAHPDGRLERLTGEATVYDGEQAIRPVTAGAYLAHDPALSQDLELVHAVARATGLALDNLRLREETQHRLAALEDAQRRIVEAGDSARRRIERDLHDGVQQTLVSLSMALGLALDEPAGSPEIDDLLQTARQLSRSAAEEVRSLAHGVYPALLASSGLDEALADLAPDRAPPNVTMDLGLTRRAHHSIEAAAYFCCREALANILKHARATHAWISTREIDGRLVVRVVDDGVGGAEDAPWSGLLGLADRAGAHHGSLTLSSPVGGPTALTVTFPAAFPEPAAAGTRAPRGPDGHRRPPAPAPAG